MLGLFRFGLSAICQSILRKDLTIRNLLIILANGVDMSLDGLHEHRAKRLTVGLPSDGSTFFNSRNASDPRLLFFTLQLLDLIHQLLQTLHHHFYLCLLKHAISQLDEFVHSLVLLPQYGLLRIHVAFFVAMLFLIHPIDLNVIF